MSLWMGWATVVTLLLGAAAWLGERAARDAGLPGRWAWFGALGTSVGLMVWSLLRPATPPVGSGSPDGPGGGSLDLAWLASLPARATDGSPAVAEQLDTVLTWGWIASATVVAVALVGGLVRLRRHAAGWEARRIEGEDVLLSDDFGPALVGVWSPRIVLPRWALALPKRELRLAYRHEAEHREASDTRLMFGAAVVAALVPWNAGIWWIVRRLRAAVEVDCDERVLRSGAPRGAYAALLLDMGVRASRAHLPGLAFARPKSLLERRMRMIVNGVNSRRIARAVPAAAAALVLVVAACDTSAPTTPVDGKIAAALVAAPAEGAAEERSGTLVKLSETGTRFVVDGEEVERLPTELDPALIERVEVTKGVDGEPSTVSVFLVRTETSGPAVFIDGEQIHTSDPKAELAEIAPERIERVDVRKSAEGAEIHVFLKPVPGGATP